MQNTPKSQARARRLAQPYRAWGENVNACAHGLKRALCLAFRDAPMSWRQRFMFNHAIFLWKNVAATLGSFMALQV